MSDPIDDALKEIETFYSDRSYRERLKVMVRGIKAPRNSKAYKEALIEVQRLSAPVLAVCLPVLAVCLLTLMPTDTMRVGPVIETRVLEAEEYKELEEIREDFDQPQETVDDERMDIPISTPHVHVDVSLAPGEKVSPQPQPFDAVMAVKSPMILKNIYGSTRQAGTRGQTLNRFGGDRNTEDAVMRALRWLKTRQRPDGGWDGQSEGTGSTGFAILAYLAHGEIPGSSVEFGTTVQRAVEYLMRQPHHDPMATHALAEAYGMTQNPNLRLVAEKSLTGMIDKLLVTTWGPGRDGDGTTRPDLLGMAFGVMALRSAKLANLRPKGMDDALKKLKEGFLAQGNRETGGFSSDHYGPPGPNYRRTGTWHFMIGVVGMQYLGAFADPLVEKTMAILDDAWPPPTLGTTDIACCPVRSNYWSTMVFFNSGGKRWEKWNKAMKSVYVTGQEVETGKYKDPEGKDCEIGYWRCEDQHIGLQPIMPTCYIVQQLMVYYRYLPTGSKAVWEGSEELRAAATDKEDISVDTGTL